MSEIDRLRRDCAEAYQVVAVLAHIADMFEHADVIRALDNLAAASAGRQRPHENLLPFAPRKTKEPDLNEALALALMALGGVPPGKESAHVLAALDAAGFQIVPKLPTAEMVATALPLATEPPALGYVLRAHRALALLPIGAEFGSSQAYQDGLTAASELIRDYCAMLAAAPKP